MTTTINLKPPLSEQVKELEQERNALVNLCGDIIATLTLPANQPHMHAALILHAEQWRRAFNKTVRGR